MNTKQKHFSEVGGRGAARILGLTLLVGLVFVAVTSFSPKKVLAATFYSQTNDSSTAYDGFVFFQTSATSGAFTHVQFKSASTTPAYYRAAIAAEDGSGSWSAWSDTTSYTGAGTIDLYWASSPRTLAAFTWYWFDFQVSYDGSTWYSAYSAPRNYMKYSGSTIYAPHWGSYPQYYMLVDDSVYVPPITDTTTRIISTTPVNGATVSTTTTVGADLYINSDDYDSDMYLAISFTNQAVLLTGGSVFDAASPFADGQIRIPITATGTVSLSTTTTFTTAGDTSAVYKIVNPSFGSNVLSFFGIGDLFGSVKAQTDISFTVGYRNALDVAVSQGTAAVANTILYGTTTSPVLDCHTSQFSLEKCLISIIVPNATTTSQLWESAKDKLFTRVPFGYVTRIISIFATTSPVMPPALTYTFGSSSPSDLQGKTVSFQIFDHFDVVQDIRSDDGQNKNIFQIIDPYIKAIVALAVFFYILSRLLNIDIKGYERQVHLSRKEKRTIETSYKKNDFSDLTQSEFENLRRNRLL